MVGFLVENMEKSASEFCINTQKSHKFCFSSSPWSLDYKMCHWNLLLTSTHTYWIFMHLRRLNRETYAVSKTNWFVAVNQYNCFFYCTFALHSFICFKKTTTGENCRFDWCIRTNQCKSCLSLVAKSACLQTATAANTSGPIYETFFCSGSLKPDSFGY